MATEEKEVVVSSSILAQFANSDVDWLSIPPEQRLIDDETLEWLVGDVLPTDGGSDDFNLAEEPPKPKKSRFDTVNVTSESKLATFSEGFVPQNTKASTNWALRTFNEWMAWRNETYKEDPVPLDILQSGDAVAINKWFSLFVIEIRKKKSGAVGERYPTSTLNSLLSGLKRYMMKCNPSTPNFLDEHDPRFSGLRGTRDRVARSLRDDGVGAVVKHTPIITIDEENLLWSQGVLGMMTPTSLLNTVFFLNGKMLCLRGGREHRDLKIAQFIFDCDEGGDYVQYSEHGSKNRSGSYKDKGENKIVKHYAQVNDERCYVRHLQFYLSKLPAQIREDSSSGFYWKPLGSISLVPRLSLFLFSHNRANIIRIIDVTHNTRNFSK